jgi:hypothetical protein
MFNLFKKRPAPVLTEATGVAVARKRTMGPKLEAAMAHEIQRIEDECGEIWHNAELGDEDKIMLIAAKREPAEMKRRMLEAKAAAKAALGV